MGALSELLFDRLNVADFLMISGITLLFVGLFLELTKLINGRLMRNWLLIAFLFYYVVIVLCYTVFCRKMGNLTQFRPIPFYNLFDGTPISQFVYEGLLNMVMFIPMGIGAALIKWNKWHIMGGALILSMSIEMMQWFLKCGCCEMNDVINNGIGCAIGLGLAQCFRYNYYSNDKY